uniref:PiggyBac transposable element-derived protein domain-containing protein n=1 Tax=Strigamia maritima TaxID=126957 RepID=T1IMK4_STRMM
MDKTDAEDSDLDYISDECSEFDEIEAADIEINFIDEKNYPDCNIVEQNEPHFNSKEKNHVPVETLLIDAFKLFISPQIIDIVVKYTNQRGNRNFRMMEKRAKHQVWQNVDATEIYATIGILILAGSFKESKLALRFLWHKDPSFSRQIYTAVMSRNRFTDIFTALRFDDALTRSERLLVSRLAPISEVSEIFQQNSRAFGTVGDKLIGEYSCRRATRRWPLVIFQNYIDIGAHNALVVWKASRPHVKTCRRGLLQDLGMVLVRPQIAKRARIIEGVRRKGYQQHVLRAIEAT